MRTLLLVFFFLVLNNCIAQVDSLFKEMRSETKSYGIFFQYNGITKPYVELGLGKSTDGIVGHHPFTTGSYVSSELKIDFNRTVLGPKIGVWASGGVAPFSSGLNIIYYADISEFDQGAIRIRPEFGLGLFNFRTYFGVNIPITKYISSKEYVSLYTLGVMWYLPIIKRK